MQKIIVTKHEFLDRITVFQKDSERLAIIDNQEIPAWSISNRYSRFEKHFQELLEYAIIYQENKKLYQFFMLSELNHFVSDRYTGYLEHIIKKNSLSGYENIDHDVLEYQTNINDRLIYLWVLKNEYRIV